MIEQLLNDNSKAVIIEIMDVFYEMDHDGWNEDITEKEEKDAHIKVIEKQLKKAKQQGFSKWLLLNRNEAEGRKQDLGLNGISLLIFRK